MEVYSIAYSLKGDNPRLGDYPRLSGVFSTAESAEEHRKLLVKRGGAKNSFVFKDVRPASDVRPITWNEAFEAAVPFVQRACEAFRPRQTVYLHFFGDERKEWGDMQGIVKTIADKTIVVETIGTKKAYIWFASTGIGDRWASDDKDYPHCELFHSTEDFLESMNVERIRSHVRLALGCKEVRNADYELLRDLEQVLYKHGILK